MGMRYTASLVTAWALPSVIVELWDPVPVDCTPDEEQCSSETEGGFETGTVADVTAGGAVVIALEGGASLGGGDDSGGSGGGSSSK